MLEPLTLNAFIMKNYYLLSLVFLLLTLGCRKEINVAPAPQDEEIVSKVTHTQTVTTIDGIVTESNCSVITLRSGEIYQICIPTLWNGDLILYAHGYVSEFEPLALPTEAAAYVPLFTTLGFAFATTSYSENGLAIQTGIDNIIDLRKRVIKEFVTPNDIFLTGGSEGGVITTLAVERYPDLFSGGLPLCGPIGDFQRQINYYGDFRVLFDYFFPGVLPGTAISIPDELITSWEAVYVPAVLNAIRSNPTATIKLLNTAGAAYTPGDNTTIEATVLGLLRYNVFATRDAINKLKGQPFDNATRVYAGTGSPEEDALLNQQVQRFTADKKALKTIAKDYETSGAISLPLVAAHTTGDPIIPFWHLPLYEAKTDLQGTGALFTGLPVERYGHCTFTDAEVIGSFALLFLQVKGVTLSRAEQLVRLSSSTQGKVIQSVRME
jgi:hypothetical protein